MPWRVSDRAPSGVLPDRVVPALVWDVPAAVHMHPHMYAHTLYMCVQICAHTPPHRDPRASSPWAGPTDPSPVGFEAREDP